MGIIRCSEKSGKSSSFLLFYKVENAGHEISGLPMSRNQYDIMSFLGRQVLGDENLAITTDERVPGDTIVRKDFTVQDYILDNLR